MTSQLLAYMEARFAWVKRDRTSWRDRLRSIMRSKPLEFAE